MPTTKQTPADARASIVRAADALRGGRAADALALLRGLPPSADALYLRALALSALGRLRDGDAAFEAAAAAGAPLGELRLNQGNMHRRAGAYEAALGAYDAAAAARPPAAPLPLALARGEALAALGRLDEARAAYDAALRAAPGDAAALTGLGGVLNGMGRAREAAAALDRALAARRTGAALNNRASSARALGAFAEELSLLREAAGASPRNPDILANRARAAARAGEKAEAIGGFVAALGAAPLRLDIQRDLARYLWEAGERGHMLRGFDAVPASAPDAVRLGFHLEAGALAAKAGWDEVARDRFARALRLDPASPAALVGAAEAAAAGDARRAAWSRAIAAAPGDPGVRLGYAWHLIRDTDDPAAAEPHLASPVPAEHEQRRLAYDGVAARLLGRARYRRDHDADRLVGVRPIAPPPGETLAGFLRAVEDALAPHFIGDGAPVDQTLFGGQQSRGDLFATEVPTLAALRCAMLTQAQAFWDGLDLPADHPLTARGRGPLGVGAAWSVRLTSGGGHRDHVHTRGPLSSAHYVTVPPLAGPGDGEGRPGWLRLGRPDLDRDDLPATRHVRPEPGVLVLFPSYLWHGVEPFEAAGARVTTPADFVRT